MLELIEILKHKGIIKFRQEFCDTIGMQKQNIRSVQTGKSRFTVEQIEIVCNTYNVNPSWVFGYSTETFRSKTKLKAMQDKNA